MYVCLFDIDGTLLNTGGAGQAAMEAAFAVEFGVTEPVNGLSTAGRTDRAIMLDLFDYFGIVSDQGMWQRFQAAYLHHLPEHLSARQGLVLPGIGALLEALGDHGEVVLGLLTGNFREGARLKLGHYELAHHFQFGGYGDRHIDRDDVAREALAEIHGRFDAAFDSKRVWVVGDTPADVQCGRAIGANVVAVGTGMYSADELEAAAPDHLVTDFSDPETLLSLIG